MNQRRSGLETATVESKLNKQKNPESGNPLRRNHSSPNLSRKCLVHRIEKEKVALQD